MSVSVLNARNDKPLVSNSDKEIVLRAMISAAIADGHIDTIEHQRLFRQVDLMHLTTEERLFLLDEFQAPKTVEQVAMVVDDVRLARRVYESALLVLDDCRVEAVRYLTRLATLLELSESETRAIKAESLEMSRVRAA
ncbi:MAG: DUF533 domain-containing protein [Pseudomonadales bacterium]